MKICHYLPLQCAYERFWTKISSSSSSHSYLVSPRSSLFSQKLRVHLDPSPPLASPPCSPYLASPVRLGGVLVPPAARAPYRHLNRRWTSLIRRLIDRFGGSTAQFDGSGLDSTATDLDLVAHLALISRAGYPCRRRTVKLAPRREQGE